MPGDDRDHHRRSIRLDEYDYAESGAYFVTICTQGHLCLFGEIVDGQMRMNALGQMVQETWCDLPSHYPHVELDAFVVMPNHVHMVIVLTEGNDLVGAGFKPALVHGSVPMPDAAKRHRLSEIVRAFKTFSSRQVGRCRGTQGVPLWQRNYYEHIIRSERALNHIRRYIAENPLRWAQDRENPAATAPEAPDAWRIDHDSS